MVLSAGPGWNWETLRSRYLSVATYTEQLRALERLRAENPQRADAAFVLAYHYLTIGELNPASRMLEIVVKLNPADELSAAILKTLAQTQQPSDRPRAGR